MSYDAKIYVGNLPPDIRDKDVEDFFYKFGRIVNIDLHNTKGPPYAFVEFEDPRDALDAIAQRNNYKYDGYTLRVESPRGNTGGDRGGRDRYSSRDRGGGFRGSSSRGSRYGSRGGSSNGAGGSRRTDFRVFVRGLPKSGSWQDLKDHMRQAGDVCFADVFKDGTGMVEYQKQDDMKFAEKKLDDSEFTSHEGERSTIQVIQDRGRGSSGGRGRSRSRSRSRSYSPKRSRRSPSYSSMKRSDSRSRSRSTGRDRGRFSPY